MEGVDESSELWVLAHLEHDSGNTVKPGLIQKYWSNKQFASSSYKRYFICFHRQKTYKMDHCNDENSITRVKARVRSDKVILR